jgi:replication factor C small subunit
MGTILLGADLEPLLWSIKYHPTSWNDFVGQDSAINHLKNLSETSILPNMIFYGPAGTGKTSAAEVFSREILGSSFNANYKALNIRDMWDFSLTDAKRSVQDIAKLDRSKRSEFDEYMSVVYREAQSTLKLKGNTSPPNRSQLLLEAIRFFASTRAVAEEKLKILVLDEADALSNSMQQALRRTMELYSDACRFILITPSLAGWSPAIISRCNVVNFPTPDDDIIAEYVLNVAKKESVKIDSGAAKAIARECSGDLRRALNLLQIVSTASDHVTEDTVYAYSETPLVKDVREIVTLALEGSFEPARKKMRNLLALDGYSAQEVLLEIERDLVKRPFDHNVLSKVLGKVAEIDHRVIQGKNSFIHLAALLASLKSSASEFTEVAQSHP